MTAVERGQELMEVPMDQLPEAALKFAADLCRRFGMCGEVCLTAYTIYAQVVEGLPCNDGLYEATEERRAEFEAAQSGWSWNSDHTALVFQKPLGECADAE